MKIPFPTTPFKTRLDEIKDKAKQTPIPMPDADLMQLADKIVAVTEMGKQQLAISIAHPGKPAARRRLVLCVPK